MNEEEIKQMINKHKDLPCGGSIEFFVMTSLQFLKTYPIFKSLYADVDELVKLIKYIHKRRITKAGDSDLFRYTLHKLGVTEIDYYAVRMFDTIEDPQEAFVKLKEYISSNSNKDYSERSGEFFNAMHDTALPETFFRSFNVSTIKIFSPIFKYVEVERLTGKNSLCLRDLIISGVTHNQLINESGLSSIFEGLTIKEGNELIEDFLIDKTLGLLNTYSFRHYLLVFLEKKSLR